MIENLPSQAVCARWMPNFAGIVLTTPFLGNDPTMFFGVDTRDSYDHGRGHNEKWFLISQSGYDHEPTIANKLKTVVDGWGEDFYYCSFPPYQSYQLWSSGPNKRTFPPWMEMVSGKEELITRWVQDDIKVGDK